MYVHGYQVDKLPLSQKTSTPRLELQAAVTATRIQNTITNEIRIENESPFLWVDSTIILKYLNNNDTNFGVHLVYRINKIR